MQEPSVVMTVQKLHLGTTILQNTDVACRRKISSSKLQVLIKENKSIKRNLRKNRVHFHHNK